jgi:hypothetical protein
MTLSTFEQISTVLVLSTALGQAAIVGIILRKKIRDTLPIFLAYNVSGIVTALVLGPYVAAFGASSNRYFWMYWILNATLMILGFGVLYEILKVGLKPFSGLVDLGKLLFGWAALFLVVAAGLTALTTLGPTPSRYIAAVHLLGRSLLLMQCGLLLLFFLFERRLALPWRSYPVSLALGFGASAGLSLTFSFLRVHFACWSQRIDLADNLSGLLVVLFWAICLALPQPARRSVMDSPSRLIFQRWNEALLAGPLGAYDRNTAVASVDSFLPGIEKTVDKILARKIAN